MVGWVLREEQVAGSFPSYAGNALLNLFKMGEEKHMGTKDDLPAQQGTDSTRTVTLDLLWFLSAMALPINPQCLHARNGFFVS